MPFDVPFECYVCTIRIRPAYKGCIYIIISFPPSLVIILGQQPRPAQSQLMVVMLKVNDSSQFVASIISIRLTVQSGKGGKCVIGWPTIDARPNKPNSSQMSPSVRLLQYFCL